MTDIEIAPWMQTLTGKAVDILDPTPDQIDPQDIAVALERIPRFNGHTTGRVWSIARHSHLVANLLPHIAEDPDPGLRLAALLHDAHESYIGDPIAPLKAAFVKLLGFDPFKRLEGPLIKAIRIRFGLPETLPEAWTGAIRQADLTALHIEKLAFMGAPPRPWAALPAIPVDPYEEIDAIDLYHGAFGCFYDQLETALQEIAEHA